MPLVSHRWPPCVWGGLVAGGVQGQEAPRKEEKAGRRGGFEGNAWLRRECGSESGRDPGGTPMSTPTPACSWLAHLIPSIN